MPCEKKLGYSGNLLIEVESMSTENERVFDPQLGKVITRLKRTAQQIRQECEEKDRCVREAEEILRQASMPHR